MISCKTVSTGIVLGGILMLTGHLSAPAAARGCQEPATGTSSVPIISPPLSKVVTGAGRLQFYSAPNSNCRMDGVFVIRNDELVAYAETTDGWTQVTFFPSGSGSETSGWVRSERLRTTGTMGPTSNTADTTMLEGDAADNFIAESFPDADIPGYVKGKYVNSKVVPQKGYADCDVPAMGERSNGAVSTCKLR